LVVSRIRVIFDQPDCEDARRQLKATYDAMLPRWPKAAEILDSAEEEVLTFMEFPPEHWKRISSNNVLERLNKEVKRRANVVGAFPDEPSVVRLVGAILKEQDDDWKVTKCYFSKISMRKVLYPPSLLISEITPSHWYPYIDIQNLKDSTK
jgi:putative transposase